MGLALLLIGGLYLGDRLFLEKRGIASVDEPFTAGDRTKYYDLSDLTGPILQKSAKMAMAQGFQVQKTAQEVGLSFGGFLVQNAQGAKVYACEKYPNVELVLKAEGVAYSGNIPTLIVRGPCVTSDDGQKITALPVPLKDLYKNLKENPLWRIPWGDRGESLLVSAQYLYDEWPQIWNVVQVKLYNDQESLEIDGYEIISLLDQALTLDFSEAQ